MTRTIVVFGGTGFLGRRVVRSLLDHQFAVRVASRHPERGKPVFSDELSRLEFVRADIDDDASAKDALSGMFGVVNAVSLYVERSGQTFHSVHVEAAERVARHARELGVERLVHLSGIGANPVSPSRYIRSRGEGENAVRAAFPTATVIRPAVMFGLDDAFLTPLTGLLRKFPVFPMFGDGSTRLQPAYVEDVGEAIARAFDAAQADTIYEFGGPRTYTYKELLQTVGRRLGLQRTLVPVPFMVWQALAFFAEFLPRPPITRNQIELMRVDNVASHARPGFSALDIAPHGIETVLAAK
jgi:NADH dehydrogenase